MATTQPSPRLNLSCLHAYQTRAIQHTTQRRQAMLWLDMGLGKTVVTLSAIAEKLDRLQISGALVLAPLRVIQSVWRQEAAKWEHTKGLRFSLVSGTKDARTRAALLPADVYLCNYENLTWLADCWTQYYLSRGRYLPVNMVVFDEITKGKNATAKRHEALQRLTPFMPHRVGLTGTPASNGYQDLFGQYLAVDSGERLGTSKTAFMNQFFRPENPMSPFGKQKPTETAEDLIESLVADITIQMKAEDYIELPEVLENELDIELPPSLMKKYKKLEDEMWVELDSGHQIESFNAAALTNRGLQFAQGAMYLNPGAKQWESVHDLKLDALESVVNEANGKPALIAIEYQHDAERILKKYPGMVWVKSSMSGQKFNQVLDQWEEGTLPGIIVHPASAGHGIDRLKNGPVDDVVWFGHTWSLDQYEQLIARLKRQGRTRPIRLHHITARGTIEVAQRLALTAKARSQDKLKEALNEYRKAAA